MPLCKHTFNSKDWQDFKDFAFSKWPHFHRAYLVAICTVNTPLKANFFQKQLFQKSEYGLFSQVPWLLFKVFLWQHTHFWNSDQKKGKEKFFPIQFWEIVWKVGKKVSMDSWNDCFQKNYPFQKTLYLQIETDTKIVSLDLRFSSRDCSVILLCSPLCEQFWKLLMLWSKIIYEMHQTNFVS